MDEKSGVKRRVFELVCLTPGINAEQIGKTLGFSREYVLPILYELEKVDKLIEPGYMETDEYQTEWYRR